MPGEVAEFGQDMEDAAQTWGLGGCGGAGGGAEGAPGATVSPPPGTGSASRGGGTVCAPALGCSPSRAPPPIAVHGSFCVTQEVPDPTKYFVTRWSTDPWIQMAYSFVKTGGSGEAYDIIAEEIQGTVFFAGEVRVRSLSPAALVWLTFFSRKGCTSRVAERKADRVKRVRTPGVPGPRSRLIVVLGFGSGYELGVLRWSPALGSLQGRSRLRSFPLPCSLSCSLPPLSLSQE